MVAACVLGSLLLTALPASSADTTAADRASYEEARARVGRDPDAQIRLALWCEAHGLNAERIRHLAIAVLSDPSNATARGLLGLVSYGGKWKRPDEVANAARSNDTLQALLAEYNTRRERMPETADAHWELGLWCEQKRLAAEARAHFTAVTRIDPDRADAWRRLGCRRFGGRWLSESQIAAERAEIEAQNQADVRWDARIKEWWRDWLAGKERRAEAESALAETLESRAVPTIRKVLVNGTSEQQFAAATLFDRIDSAESTRELARLAVMGHGGEVRQSAIQSLARRDPNEVIEPLVELMRTPMGVRVVPSPRPNAIGELRVEDEREILRKVYVQHRVRVPSAGGSGFGFLNPIFNTPRRTRTAGQQLSRDLNSVARRNEVRGEVNDSARSVLIAMINEDQGPEPESWRRWLSEKRGYAYTPVTTPKHVITRVSEHVQYQFGSAGFHSYCFAKGTPVRTLLGLQPIETIRVGDQVLAEDPNSGALSFQPVVVAYHNPPSPTLKIGLGTEDIVTTPIHRFWRSGKGWVLARDLKAGDSVRVLGGVASIVSVETDIVQAVFNLELAEEHNYFVGVQGALVHDNSRAQAPVKPFDAALALTTEHPSK